MKPAASDDMASQDVFGGVDSHADTLHVAVIGDNGGHLADAEFTTTRAGYAADAPKDDTVTGIRAPHNAARSVGKARTAARNPGLRAAHGVGPDTAARLLVTAGGNPERMRRRR
ncbi:hypothetical protein [Streptomyces sp. Ncost-T10-10d]|uniref:hypothetical protein n=1 Tax=Streptomyces sp. Ncost-T10-10d TaxID=1839774 RepID=UPI00081E58F2|nr:hypothetical protein [Streptomyces sp. Ncost-T10-10d]SCF66993.1 hypothetical protein GA0115254_110620 [Streptomyces sp. Ncost-T10-10d]